MNASEDGNQHRSGSSTLRRARGAWGLVRRYIEKMTGLSRAQVTRLIARYSASGRVMAGPVAKAAAASGLVCKYPPAEPEALRLLAPQRGLFATVESKSKNKSKASQRKHH
jgi:hypothetical protein